MARVMDFLKFDQPAGPPAEIGIGGFTALVRVKEGYNLSASVPDIPVEDGSVIHDHVILAPLTISIEGDVSDVHLRESPELRAIRQLEAEIGNVTALYAPARTQSQLSRVAALANDVLDAGRRIDSLIERGEQVGKLFGNQDTASTTNRQRFLDFMERTRNTRVPITIEMPYRRCDNMIITTLSVNYDNETDSTTFKVEAQQIRFAELKYAAVERKRSKGTGGQIDSEKNKGAKKGTEVPRSLLSNIFGGA